MRKHISKNGSNLIAHLQKQKTAKRLFAFAVNRF